MNLALAKLTSAQERTESLISAGLEPAREYLPATFKPDARGMLDFMRCIIEATSDLVCAYKLNLAFFESLGLAGATLLDNVRKLVPANAVLIADAKRGDIGTTAKHYAASLFDVLGADAATVNPLMGQDSAEPFLSHTDKLTFFLVLTSNPGAKDFLLPNQLYRTIASTIAHRWNGAGNCGFVVGATKPQELGEIRMIAPRVPFLVPGIGAQGGDFERAAELGRIKGGGDLGSGLIFHVTRGLLPEANDLRDPATVIREKAERYRELCRRVMSTDHAA